MPQDHFLSIRHDWSAEEVSQIFRLPFNDLLYHAQGVHRHYFDANTIQLSTLINIKAGACPEDCAYCPQSARHDTELEAEALMEVEAVLKQARQAKAKGASRFCMGAAWRGPKDRDLQPVLKMISGVKALGLETCATLGMLKPEQATALRDAGLDYYNHNLDTSEDYYKEIISTRRYQDRLDTLAHVRDAGMKVCCGGIIGMGEDDHDRVELLRALANLPHHPESVPVNLLVPVSGTPLAEQVPPLDPVDPLEFVRTIAVARLLMPASYVRLSAGREQMSDELQALCFQAGANSVFYGEQLLTTPNPQSDRDQALFARLGLRPEQADDVVHPETGQAAY
ncbi:MAG: biotin synthase BioB [Gammaproteobacteria bacterium]|nr:biotin synthase BioB [Gammaproteobacteria bacterium]